MLRSKEWLGDGMTSSGGVMAWVLYAPDDGSAPQWVDLWIPFQAKWNFPETQRDGVMRQVPVIRNVDARIVSARKLMVRASVGVWAEALEPYELEVYTPGEPPEGVALLRNTYPVMIIKEAGEKAFLLDEELILPGSCPPAEAVVRFELMPQLSDSRVMAGKVVFRGNGLLQILYRGEDGAFHTCEQEIPFSQFAELEEDMGADAEARIAFAVTNLELDKNEDGSLRLKCGLVGQYLIQDRVHLEIAEDAYSPHREVTPCFQSVTIPAVLEVRTEQIAGEVTLDAKCSRIVDLAFWPDHPAVSRMGDQVRMSMSGVFQVLYEDLDGNLQSAARHWEQEKGMEAAENCMMSGQMAPVGSPVAQTGGGSVTMRGNVAVAVHTEATQGQSMLSGMELGEEKKPDQNRPSVILRRAEGERLWDIAKCCGTTVRSICQANGLKDEPDPGRLLLIPVL